ncbi:multidrug effflux MFS transporter [Paenibacillus harenae]|uniref:Bcr/CflA family efflux transporter n=1 Tax=Paenibacillus harenae TaxID=306543 RepID=A0ABT9U9I6_PAEHA|nr:multidrug effflux MFS transporter [Paenibacillus harenae]MDQ0115094.1 DHA1 family bicyclomycin/chloramphenicol resistance-like MFS transporter [Paenibacillus harenae]
MNHTESLAAPTQRGSRLWIAIVLGSLAAIGPLSLDMYLPALPALAEELGSTTSATQLSLTACMLGLALGQLFAGPISDVRGRRVPLIIGIAVYAMVSALCFFAPNIWVFVGLRFIQGLAGAAGIVISRASARDLYSGVELTKFFALLMLINGAAPILAPIVGAEVLVYTSWRGVFAILGVLGTFMLLAILFGLKETLPLNRRSSGGIRNTISTFRRLAVDRSFMGYALTQGFVMAAMFAYISGSPFVLQELFGVSPRTYSLIFGMNGAGIIIASQVAGRLAGRIAARRLLASGLTLSALGAVLLLLALWTGAGLKLIVPGFFLLVSSVGLVSTTTTSLALQSQGQSAGSASALLGMLSFIIGGLAAPLVGIGGNETAIPLVAVIAILVVAAFGCFRFLAAVPGVKSSERKTR